MNEAQKLIAANMSEEDLLSNVIDMAHRFGWRVAHFRPAKTDKGWRTAVQGDSGFPDLVLARNGVVLTVELKSEAGTFSKKQEEWREGLGKRYIIWRPSDWLDGTIEKMLRGH